MDEISLCPQVTRALGGRKRAKNSALLFCKSAMTKLGAQRNVFQNKRTIFAEISFDCTLALKFNHVVLPLPLPFVG